MEQNFFFEFNDSSSFDVAVTRFAIARSAILNESRTAILNESRAAILNDSRAAILNGSSVIILDTTTAAESEPFINKINFIFIPVIILLGTIGNLLSLAVFRNTKLRRLSTSCYLTALALSDTGFLLTLLASWLELNKVPAYNQPVLCPLITYVSMVCSFLSPWLVVAFTVERYVATCYPLRRASICTISRARVVVTSLTVVASMFYSYTLVMAGHYGEPEELVQPDSYEQGPSEWSSIENGSGSGVVDVVWNITQYKCGVKPAYMDAMNVLNWVDTVITLIIPSIIIIVLNMLIARAVIHFERVRRRMTTSSAPNSNAGGKDDECGSGFNSQDGVASSRLYGSNTSVLLAARLHHSVDSNSTRRAYHRANSPVCSGTASGMCKGGANCNHQRSVRGRYQMKITKMVLMISSVFLALNLPSYLARLWGFVCGTNCRNGAVLLYNVQQWSQLAFYLNFAVNFLLYCASGQNFRNSLLHLVCKVLNRASHGRHFSRKNTGNTTCSTTVIVNNGTSPAAPPGGVSAAMAAYRQLPMSAAGNASVKGGHGRSEASTKAASTNRTQTDTV